MRDQVAINIENADDLVVKRQFYDPPDCYNYQLIRNKTTKPVFNINKSLVSNKRAITIKQQSANCKKQQAEGTY